MCVFLGGFFHEIKAQIDIGELKWDYPIKPKTEEWKKLKNNKAKVDACQIPTYILHDISTNDLMILCLQYPLLFDVFAFNDINDGMKKLFDDFNGIREFSQRKDALNNLREKYLVELSVFPSKFNTLSTLEIVHSKVQISMLELLLSYFDFYTNSSKEEKKEVLQSLLYGYLEKIKYPEYFQGIGFTTNLYARVNLITKIDTALSKKFEGENSSVLFSGRANADLINTIDSLSYNLIK